MDFTTIPGLAAAPARPSWSIPLGAARPFAGDLPSVVFVAPIRMPTSRDAR
jgi:hypothetical protein